LAPKSATVFIDRADIYKRMFAYDKAIADYTKAAEVDPAQAKQTQMALGLVRFYKGDFKSAADDLLRVIERQDESYAMLFRYLARARAGEDAAPELDANSSRLQTREWPFAVMELLMGKRTTTATMDAAKDDNERCEAHFYIGEWHLLKGERPDAVRAFGEALKLCPKSYYEYTGAKSELTRLRD
jgi:lipoprotein NlpI